MNIWHRWFAWYPVAFGPHIIWLKMIERRFAANGDKYFRIIPKDQKQGH